MSLENLPKVTYLKKSTRDFSHIKQVVDPELKKANDRLFKVLVGNINRNATEQDKESDPK